MSKILDNLYVGSIEDAFNVNLLHEHINSVLNVASELNLLKRPYHVSKKISINDDDPDETIIPKVIEAITWIKNEHDNNRTILVHCLEGRSRSVCVVLAYLATYIYNNDLNKAINHVKQRHKNYNPYWIYYRQLAYHYEHINDN